MVVCVCAYIYATSMYVCVCVCVCTGGGGGMDRGILDISDNVQHFCKNGKPSHQRATSLLNIYSLIKQVLILFTAAVLIPSGHVGAAMFSLEHKAGQLQTTPGDVSVCV